MEAAKKQQDVFVVERYFDNAVGILIGAFSSLDDAQAFSELCVVAYRSPHEVEITRCTPTPRETWRRFADDRGWSTSAWEHRGIGESR